MKAIYKNIALAALAFSAVACTQEEDFAPSFLNDPDAVRITAQVASGNVTGGFTRSNPLGTTEEQAKFNDGDQIAVTAYGQDAVTYTFNGTDTWTPEEGKYLKWEEDEMNFTAWYPVGEGTDANTFTVPYLYADVNAMAAADYMVYTGTQNKTDGNGVTLAMERKMVRIVITPILNDEFLETNYSITGIKVHANTSGYASGTVQAGNIEVTAFDQNGVFYALLAPTTVDANATFLTVTVAKTDGTNSKNLFVKGIPATEAGKSYDYTLTVGKAEATIGSVKVNPWTDGTINGGKAEEVNACYLPIGKNFRNAVKEFLPSNASLTQIKFIADPNWTPQGTQIEESGAYMVANGTTLEIRTDAEVFMFNETSSSMFSSYDIIGSRITSIDFNGCINTSNVTTLASMFQNCYKLTSLNLSGFNTANVTNLKLMFDNCAALQNITFGNSFSTNKVMAMDYVFRSCLKLTSLDLTGFSFNDNLTTQEMFYYTGGSNATENRIPIKVTQTGYNFLKDKTDTKIQYSNAKYVQPDGADWPASE